METNESHPYSVKVGDTVRYSCVYNALPSNTITAKVTDVTKSDGVKGPFVSFRVSALEDPRGQDWHPADEIVEIINQ